MVVHEKREKGEKKRRIKRGIIDYLQ